MRVLIVEDEHRIANTLKKGLEQEAMAVDVAYTGTEGYDLAASVEYDLLILDLMLPGIDGITMTKKLREEGIQTPILMLTAKGEVRDRVTGLNAGADDYLAKPFAFEELLARVRALFRRPKHQTPSIVKVGDLSIDKAAYEVKRGGKSIVLSSKEYALLEYLASHPGRVLTKDQIIEHVWDYDADILPNTVEVYIRNLRKKIDEPFNTPLIHTSRGFGYTLGDKSV